MAPTSSQGHLTDDTQMKPIQVVWLPRKTYGEAQVSQKTSKTPTTLVRQADRYGLQCLANEEAEALHRIASGQILCTYRATELVPSTE